MISHRLIEEDTYRGYILDGYPRTLKQASYLDTFLADAAWPPKLPVIAINIVVSYDELKRRITGRRISESGKIYNIYSNPPKVPNRCDIDGTELIQRSDDSETVFHERMKTFEALTAPVIEHYSKQGRFHEVDGDRPVEEVTASIESALRQLRQAGA
jgi:adenylate kinase